MLQCELPYRMLLPVGLKNVWIACRAAGIDGAAAYGIRMQRDMQRLGEVAGTAAAWVAASSGDSRAVELPRLQEQLRASGACPMRTEQAQPDVEELRHLLNKGQPGFHLWPIYRRPEIFSPIVEGLLSSSDQAVSFHAAALLAMWNSPLSEPRLLAAIAAREAGPAPTGGKGAFAQEVDIPHWLLAVVLLRRCGSPRILQLLQELASGKALPLNVRTCIALTVERICNEGESSRIITLLEHLLENVDAVAKLPPTRSVRRMLEGKPQLVL
jgi:hypothetical protein